MATQHIGYFDDGRLRGGTGRYLAEIIGALDRTRFQPVFFAPCSRPWHDDLGRLGVEMVVGAGAPDPSVRPPSPQSLGHDGADAVRRAVARRRRPNLPKG